MPLFDGVISYYAYKESVIDVLKNHEEIELITEVQDGQEVIVKVCGSASNPPTTKWYLTKNGELYEGNLNELTTSYGDRIAITLIDTTGTLYQ
ncbi:MAG TPA: hypothetical protein GXZ51_00440 [Acholeplasma sp.]|nr:hypothetical protein [Acholeplasma sp.]